MPLDSLCTTVHTRTSSSHCSLSLSFSSTSHCHWRMRMCRIHTIHHTCISCAAHAVIRNATLSTCTRVLCPLKRLDSSPQLMTLVAHHVLRATRTRASAQQRAVEVRSRWWKSRCRVGRICGGRWQPCTNTESVGTTTNRTACLHTMSPNPTLCGCYFSSLAGLFLYHSVDQQLPCTVARTTPRC